MRSQAIRNAHPEVVSVNAGTTAWDKDGNVITLDEDKIKIEFDKLQTAYDAQEYARNRAKAYAELSDQLDMQYWDSVNGTTTWADHIAEIKALHPKP